MVAGHDCRGTAIRSAAGAACIRPHQMASAPTEAGLRGAPARASGAGDRPAVGDPWILGGHR